MEDFDDTTATEMSNKRCNFRDSVWKQLRISKRKSKSFVSYCSGDDELESTTSYISQPTNFRIKEVNRENISLANISIQECPFQVTGYGNLILKDIFKLKKPKKKKVTVFLFEKILIFTIAHKKEDIYYYYGSIKISNLSLAPTSHKATKILLKDFAKSKQAKNDIEYELKAKAETIQKAWRDALEKCLWQQLVHAKDEFQNG